MKERNVTLETLVKWYEEFKDNTQTARLNADRCRDYVDNKQWTEAEAAILRKRKQPVTVNNRIAQKVDYLAGLETQSRTDPKAFPRTPQHESGAEAATDSIRYVCDNTDFDNVSSDAFDNLIVEGVEGAIIQIDKKKEISIKRIPYERLVYDPFSSERDFSDSKYSGVVIWMDISEAKEKWGDKVDEIESLQLELTENQMWLDSERKRFVAVELYYMDQGIWYRCVFTKGSMLEEAEPSPYHDEDGEPDNAIVLAHIKQDREGNRYGPCWLWLDIQDEINKRHSKALHAINSRQTWAKEGMIDDVRSFKAEANKPDGHLEFPNDGDFNKDFGFVPNDGMGRENFLMYQDSIQQLDAVSANKANMGSAENASGRAIQALQTGGQIETARLRDVHSHWKKRIYRQVWNRIRQFWTEERWIRVTDNDENTRFVGLNRPVPRHEDMKKQLEEQYGSMPPGMANQLEQHPDYQAIGRVENRVEEIDVDIILDEVPDVVNIQAEQFDMLSRMYQANPKTPQNPDGIDFKDVIAVSTIRNKDKILHKELDQDEQQQKQQEDQMQQMQMKMQMESAEMQKAKLAAEIEGKQLDNAGKKSDLQGDMFVKQAEIEKKEAETMKTKQQAFGEAIQNEILQTQPITSTRVVV